MPTQLRQKIVLSLILALVVFLALAFYADAPHLFAAFERVRSGCAVIVEVHGPSGIGKSSGTKISVGASVSLLA